MRMFIFCAVVTLRRGALLSFATFVAFATFATFVAVSLPFFSLRRFDHFLPPCLSVMRLAVRLPSPLPFLCA